MGKIIINGKGAVFGRLCSFVAKKALESNEMVILNADRVIITGNKKDIIAKYLAIKKKGGRSRKGPKYSKIPYMMLKRGIRGMLPDHRKGIGKQALLKIKCYNDIPEEFKDVKMMIINAVPKSKFIDLRELADKL